MEINIHIRITGSQLVLMALLPVASLFFIGGPTAITLPFMHAAWNLGHMAFFFVATIALCYAMPNISRNRPWLYMLLVLVGSAGIEALQTRIGRDFSYDDIARNLTGASLALAIILRMKVPKIIFIAGFAFFLIEMSKFTQIALDDWHYQHRQPLIEDFESDQYMSLWPPVIERTQDIVFEGEFAGYVHLKAGKYSGIQISPVMRDWSSYQRLHLALFNSQPEERKITIRMHDIAHEKSSQYYTDRYSKPKMLQPGWNEISIDLAEIKSAPKNREMDLTRMQQIGMFYSGLATDDYLVIDDFRLEP